MDEAPRVRKFVIPGDPVSWNRAGLNGNRFFDTQKQLKTIWNIHLNSQWEDDEFFDAPLHIDYTFYFLIPKSFTKTRRAKMDGTPHSQRPDIDNLIKFVNDTCNLLLYKDDCVIATTTARKIWALEPRTEIILTQLENHDGKKEEIID